MASKATGSYESVIRGVSQQVPADRRPGQHHEQVNFISDPVRGLVRRRGSVYQSHMDIGSRNPGNPAEATYIRLGTTTFKTFDFVVGDNRYALLYRDQPSQDLGHLPLMFCFNKETRRIIPCNFDGADPMYLALRNAGVSSLVNIGRYVYAAVRNMPTTFTTEKLWDTPANMAAAVLWVIKGDYAKTFWAKVILKKLSDNSEITLYAEYKTATSSYQGVLDTSGLDPADPDYQKKVNDANNAYNTALNQWLGTSAADVLADNIANKLLDFAGDPDHPPANQGLRQAAAAAGLTEGVDIAFDIDVSTIGIKTSLDYSIEEILVSDYGDKETPMIRGVANYVSDASTDLSARHYPGKIVKVMPKKTNQEDSYYLKAVVRNITDTGISGVLTEVTWVETAGVVNTPKDVFCFATVENDQFYLSGSAAGLKALSGMTDDVPSFEGSATGDSITSIIPHFLGRKIDYLGLFQDRLVIGSDAVLLYSRPGKYLNFWRAESLTILDSDPVEVYSLGSEDDTIVYSTTFGGDTVYFGKRKQYLLSGRQVLTPKNPSITTMSSHEDAVDSRPVASGNFVFFNKFRNGFTTTHQFMAGLLQGNPETFEVSSAVSSYVLGEPLEMMALTTPNTLILRTNANANGLFIYNYLDSADGQNRMFDSWSQWRWDDQLGYHCGMCYVDGDICVFTIRPRFNNSSNPVWTIVSDKFVLDTTIDNQPYLDSRVAYSNVATGNYWLNTVTANYTSQLYGAYDTNVRQKWMGVVWPEIPSLNEAYPANVGSIQCGVGFVAYVTPTNPYVRDKNNQAIVNGRLTLEKFNVSVADTGGVTFWLWTQSRGDYVASDWSGRKLSMDSAELGIQPIVTTTVSFPVGREIRDFKYTIKSRQWLPLSITAIEYQTRFLYNSKRI